MENRAMDVEVNAEPVNGPEPDKTIIGESCPACRSGLDPTIGDGGFQAALRDGL